MSEFISVVIPCHNASRYIGATLRSVLAQRWPRLEIIVVDDGSTDGSPDLLAREFPTVTVLRQSNQGVAAARNAGIDGSQGDWIAFVDADDIWLPGKLRAQWAYLATDPTARMVYTAWHVWRSEAAEPAPDELANLLAAAEDTARWIGPSGWIYPELLLDCEVWTSTVLMQRSLLAELGPFDTTMRIGEDYDLWLRASRVTPILHVPRPLALYRVHPASITQAAPTENYRARVVTQALARWGYQSPTGDSAQPRDVQHMLAASWCSFAAAQLAAGQLQRARQASWQALRTDLAMPRAWLMLARSMFGALG